MTSPMYPEEVNSGYGVLRVSKGSANHKMYSDSSGWGNGIDIRFSGSSGFTSHSRGSIGNDLTGYFTVTAPYDDLDTAGVFSRDPNWTHISPGRDDWAGRKCRFSGSSGFTN